MLKKESPVSVHIHGDVNLFFYVCRHVTPLYPHRPNHQRQIYTHLKCWRTASLIRLKDKRNGGERNNSFRNSSFSLSLLRGTRPCKAHPIRLSKNKKIIHYYFFFKSLFFPDTCKHGQSFKENSSYTQIFAHTQPAAENSPEKTLTGSYYHRHSGFWHLWRIRTTWRSRKVPICLWALTL